MNKRDRENVEACGVEGNEKLKGGRGEQELGAVCESGLRVKPI